MKVNPKVCKIRGMSKKSVFFQLSSPVPLYFFSLFFSMSSKADIISRLGPPQKTSELQRFQKTERRGAYNKRPQARNIICQRKKKDKSESTGNSLDISLNHRLGVCPLNRLSFNFTLLFHISDGRRMTPGVVLSKLVSSSSA